MVMTPQQLATLNTHIRANQNATVIAALAIRDDDTIRDWYNGASATDAWEGACDRQALFEAMSITVFDGLTGGKRDSWRLMLEQAQLTPLDFGRPKMRSAVIDIWPAAQATSILTACTRKATRGEMVFGGSSETATVTGGTNVTATDLTLEITLSSGDISAALNLGA
jgi:hypothetical protein